MVNMSKATSTSSVGSSPSRSPASANSSGLPTRFEMWHSHFGHSESQSYDFDKFASECDWTNHGRRFSNKFSSDLFEIYRSLYSMSKLPEDHDYFLPDEIAKGARNCLALIVQNTEVEIPKILNRGGEALAFTWEVSGGKCYLNIDEADVDAFMITNDGDEFEEKYTDGEAFDANKFLQALSDRFNADIPR